MEKMSGKFNICSEVNALYRTHITGKAASVPAGGDFGMFGDANDIEKSRYQTVNVCK